MGALFPGENHHACDIICNTTVLISGGSEQICHSKVTYTIHFMLYSVLSKGKKSTITHTSCKMIYPNADFHMNQVLSNAL